MFDAFLSCRAELEGEIGTITVGSQARMMSSAMRKLCGSLSKGNTTLIFLNQIRMKVNQTIQKDLDQICMTSTRTSFNPEWLLL